MEILGIGPLEILFILIIALIVLGPRDMVNAGKTIGRTLRKIVTSPTWHAVQQTSREIRNLPNRLIREAGLEDLKDHLPDPDQLRTELSFNDLQTDISGSIQPESLEGKTIDSNNNQGFSDWISPPDTTENIHSQKNDSDKLQNND